MRAYVKKVEPSFQNRGKMWNVQIKDGTYMVCQFFMYEWSGIWPYLDILARDIVAQWKELSRDQKA